MPPEKIALGMACYGRSFKLRNPNNHGLNAPTTGPANGGRYTRESGSLSYYEICKMSTLTVVKNNAAGAPYAYSGDLWVGFDTKESLVNDKVGLIKQKGAVIIHYWFSYRREVTTGRERGGGGVF